MKTMELVYADNLTPDQLMIEDLIRIGDDIVEVLGIESDGDGSMYYVAYQNEFGEKDVIQYLHTELIPLYAFLEEE